LKSKKNGIPPPAPVTITTLPSNLSKSLLDDEREVIFISLFDAFKNFYNFKIAKKINLFLVLFNAKV
jgi:hypothetical protein